MASMACSCQGYQKILLPWHLPGTRNDPAIRIASQQVMGVSQLAARLRCGLHLAEELLDVNEISLPRQCNSWLDLLYKQEMQGASLCVVCIGRDAEVESADSVTVALLPSAQQHVTAEQHVCVQKARIWSPSLACAC
eukprot:Skav233889  [mRNA]  locus=scaffold435:153592:154509:- [translate_table: standard]